MAKTRALMTQTERDRIAEREDVEDIKRYQAISRVRRRIEEELVEDVAILQRHHEGLLEELRDVVCEGTAEKDIATSGLSEAEGAVDERADRVDAARNASEDEARLQSAVQNLSKGQRERIAENLTGSDDLLKARVDAIEKMYQELQRLGEATSDDLLDVIDPEAVQFPGGEKTSPEESSWSNLVKGKNTLSSLPGVEKPPTGNSTWRYTGDSR